MIDFRAFICKMMLKLFSLAFNVALRGIQHHHTFRTVNAISVYVFALPLIKVITCNERDFLLPIGEYNARCPKCNNLDLRPPF